MEAVNKAVAKAANAAAATCAGREVAGRASAGGKKTYSIYDIAKTPCAELVLRYSQRRKLVRRRCHRRSSSPRIGARLPRAC
jgi:hypothetical protein